MLQFILLGVGRVVRLSSTAKEIRRFNKDWAWAGAATGVTTGALSELLGLGKAVGIECGDWNFFCRLKANGFRNSLVLRFVESCVRCDKERWWTGYNLLVNRKLLWWSNFLWLRLAVDCRWRLGPGLTWCILARVIHHGLFVWRRDQRIDCIVTGKVDKLL